MIKKSKLFLMLLTVLFMTVMLVTPAFAQPTLDLEVTPAEGVVGVESTLSAVVEDLEEYYPDIDFEDIEFEFGWSLTGDWWYEFTPHDYSASMTQTPAENHVGTYMLGVRAKDYPTYFDIIEYTVVDEASDNADLSVFTLNEVDVLGLQDIEVANPAEDAGAELEVADFTDFNGIVATPDDAGATREVTLNDVAVAEGDLETQVMEADDTIVVTVTAEDEQAVKHYKVTVAVMVVLDPVDLGTAGDYAILAKTGISTVPDSSAITGNIGVSPIAATAITGFSLIMDATGEFSTSSQITGKAYAADYDDPTPDNLTTAIGNMETAYTDAAGRAADYTELYDGDIGGEKLTAGVYKWGTDVLIDTDVTLEGGENDVWIFQIAKGITQASDTSVILTGGAQAKNIFWQAVETVEIGTGAHFEGTILGMTDITLKTGASINGRLLAQTAVTLDKSTVIAPGADTTQAEATSGALRIKHQEQQEVKK